MSVGVAVIPFRDSNNGVIYGTWRDSASALDADPDTPYMRHLSTTLLTPPCLSYDHTSIHRSSAPSRRDEGPPSSPLPTPRPHLHHTRRPKTHLPPHGNMDQRPPRRLPQLRPSHDPIPPLPIRHRLLPQMGQGRRLPAPANGLPPGLHGHGRHQAGHRIRELVDCDLGTGVVVESGVCAVLQLEWRGVYGGDRHGRIPLHLYG